MQAVAGDEPLGPSEVNGPERVRQVRSKPVCDRTGRRLGEVDAASEGALLMTTPFTMLQVSETDWLIYDTRFPLDDSRHVVAYAGLAEDFFEVTWVRQVPLPSQYLRLEDAIDELDCWDGAGTARGATRPTLIPHRPPAR